MYFRIQHSCLGDDEEFDLIDRVDLFGGLPCSGGLETLGERTISSTIGLFVVSNAIPVDSTPTSSVLQSHQINSGTKKFIKEKLMLITK